jgi:hypothetical protein
MGTKQERRAARALVAGYHEARLAELLDHVATRSTATAPASWTRSRSTR